MVELFKYGMAKLWYSYYKGHSKKTKKHTHNASLLSLIPCQTCHNFRVSKCVSEVHLKLANYPTDPFTILQPQYP